MQGEISLLYTIPGIQKFSALCILSEIGKEMDAFVKASQRVGWAGLRPRNDESAGKQNIAWQQISAADTC